MDSILLIRISTCRLASDQPEIELLRKSLSELGEIELFNIEFLKDLKSIAYYPIAFNEVGLVSFYQIDCLLSYCVQ